jgi:DNA-binding transcriptional MerR regulator/methylmalonyl-CoA mutase cobalamin-binding subunit
MDRGESGSPTQEEETFALRVASRLTGLSPDLLRAWERRYAVVVPLRTPGGTRRYRARDLERLRRVKAAVDAGHRVSEVAQLEDEELEGLIQARQTPDRSALEEALEAIRVLDAAAAERIVGQQLAGLGPIQFAREFALPLLNALGEGWAQGEVCVASEHLGTGLLRSMVGSGLRTTAATASAPPIVFATPSGELHEMGLLIAAVTTLGSGGNPVYLGPNLPVEEIVRAVETRRAQALALSLVVRADTDPSGALAELRERLDSEVEIWVGGAVGQEIELPPGCVRIANLAQLEHRVSLLLLRSAPGAS